MEVIFSKKILPKDGALVVLVTENNLNESIIKKIDEKTNGAITKAMESQKFKGKKGETVTLVQPQAYALSRIICVGLGKDITETTIQDVAGSITHSLLRSGEKSVHFRVEPIADCPIDETTMAIHLAFGGVVGSYTFDKYFTKREDDITLNKISVQTENYEEAEIRYKSYAAIANGVRMCRDLVSEPGNVINPRSLAKEIARFSVLGIDVEILEREELKNIGMKMLLGVAQGSEIGARVGILRWNGAEDKNEAPIALIGKGVTFDTGGISIKPSEGMEDMKYDMAGAAAVIGTIKSLALRNAKVNAVGVIGLVENMPSGNAQRPGDVVISLSGQTVEVINTDAEGRLVLGDIMWYAQEKYKPHTMIDLATLTGAIRIALGTEYGGLFSNDDDLASKLYDAGVKSGEKLWRMPLHDKYDAMLKSDIADMRNSVGRAAGSITAAQFLKRFVKEDVKWAHLDIASMAWTTSDLPTSPKGATGFGVRLLNKLISEYYEK